MKIHIFILLILILFGVGTSSAATIRDAPSRLSPSIHFLDDSVPSLVLKRYDGAEKEKYEHPIINQELRQIVLVERDTLNVLVISYDLAMDVDLKSKETITKDGSTLKIGVNSVVVGEEVGKKVIFSPIGAYNITSYFEKEIDFDWYPINNVSLKDSCVSEFGCYEAFDNEANGINTYRLIIQSSLPYEVDGQGNPYYMYGNKAYYPDVNDICSWYEEINETHANWASCQWSYESVEISKQEPLNASVYLNSLTLTFQSNGSIDPTYQVRGVGGSGTYSLQGRGEPGNFSHLLINLSKYPYNGTVVVPFDMDDNTTSYDYSDNDKDGTYGSGAFVQEGLFGNAVNFTGNSTSYIDYGTAYRTSTSLYAYSMWIKTDDTPSVTEIIFVNGNTGSNGYALQRLDTGAYRILHGGVAFISVGLSPTNGVWEHIAVMRHGGDVFFCKNGVLTNTSNAVYNAPSGRTVLGANNAFAQNFDGMIDDFHSYNTEVNCDDMLTIYNNQSHKYLSASNVSLAGATFTESYNLVNVSLNKRQEFFETTQTAKVYDWNITKGYDSLRTETVGNLSNELVAYLHFDNDLLDSSGVNNNGTSVGGASATGQGVYNSSLILDGSDDIVVLDELPFVGGSSTPTVFTISVWLNRSFAQPSSGQSRIFTQEHALNAGGNLYLMMDNAGTFSYDVFEPGGGVLTTSEAFNNNQWYHLVLTRSGSSRTIYVDGVIKATDTSAETYNGASSISEARIGGTHATHFFNGQLDELMFWNRSLSQEDVQQLYTQGRARWNDNGIINIESDSTIQNVSTDGATNFRVEILQSGGGFYTPVIGTNYDLTAGNSASGAPVSDSCSPDGLSAHAFLCSDNCVISSTINFNNNLINISGEGSLSVTGRLYNFSGIDRTNPTGMCYITASSGQIG